MSIFKKILNVVTTPFKAVGNLVKNTVGRVGGAALAILGAPFTGGLSLLTLPAILGKKTKGKGELPIVNPIEDPNNPNQSNPNIKTYPVKQPEPPQPSIAALEQVEPFVGIGATTGKKESVTLTGFYFDVNRITIPIDTDFNNIIVVPDTFFPYVVTVNNHEPSNEKRYISEFTYNTLQLAYKTNLEKVINDLDKNNGNFTYVTFDWQEFVNKYLAQSKGLSADGGILYWSLTPSFMLQWLDGGTTPTFPLEYSYNIPKGVKTVFDLEGDKTDARIANRSEATVPTDPKRRDRLANILSSIGAGVAYANLAVAAVGAVKSRLDNAVGAVKNLSKTASDLNEKFKNFKPLELSKDIINGKIADLKNLVNTKLPKIPSIKSFFQRKKAILEPEIKINKKELRRKAKDLKVRGKFGLKSVTGALDKVTGTLDKVSSKIDKVVSKIPKIPPAALNLAQRVSAGGKLNIGSLVSVGLPSISALTSFVPNFKNINWSDPLSAIDSITAGINGINSLGERALSLDIKTNSQKQAEISKIKKAEYDAILSELQGNARQDLQTFLKTIPLNVPLPPRPQVVIPATPDRPTKTETYATVPKGSGTNSSTPKTGTTTTSVATNNQPKIPFVNGAGPVPNPNANSLPLFNPNSFLTPSKTISNAVNSPANKNYVSAPNIKVNTLQFVTLNPLGGFGQIPSNIRRG